MKLKHLLFLFILICASCSKDDDKPITLSNIRPNETFNVYYPASSYDVLIIGGGNGLYQIKVENPSLLEIDFQKDRKELKLKPLGIGSTKIIIQDTSQNSFEFNVSIQYRESTFTVAKNSVKVVGKEITIKEKEELEQKALATIPVKPGGGYKVIYIDEEKHTGKIFIYPEKTGSNEIEGTVSVELSEKPYDYCSFILDLKGENRIFEYSHYQSDFTKSEMLIPMAFIEDVTEQFKEEYTKVEGVYTQQVFYQQ